MEDSPLQLAKREIQLSLRNKPVWVGLVAAGVILGLAGPFGTDQVLRLVPRLLYWGVMTVGFYFLGSFVGTYLGRQFALWRMPYWPGIVVAGVGAGLVIFACLMVINIALFDVPLDCTRCLAILGGNVVGIAVIVTVAIVYIKQSMEIDGANSVGTAVSAPPFILKRVPVEKRGVLLSLSVSDHYVEVVTTNGSDLVLMRLSDAMAETGDTPGLQVHRSHWVALSAIASARRDGAKAVLTLTDGREIPASRTYVPALKEAGVLPR